MIRTILSWVLAAFGVICLAPVPVAAYFGELQLAAVFTALCIMSALASFALRRRVREPKPLKVGDSMLLSALTWLFIALLSSIPFMSGNYMTAADAYFEAMSGLTTTGLTMVTDFAGFPRSLLFWRSLLQWIGGIGIVALYLLISSEVAPGTSLSLYTAEGRSERISPRISSTLKTFLAIYTAYTLIGTLLLHLAGMPPYDATCTSLSSLSTGGFTLIPNLGDYRNVWVEAVAMALMFLGSMSFRVHMNMIRKGPRQLLQDGQFRLYAALVLISTTVLALRWGGASELQHTLWPAAFQAISASSTTGFNTVDIVKLDGLSKLLLVSLMFIGAASESTGGGVKLSRIRIALLSLATYIKRSLAPPGAVILLKVEGKKVDESIVEPILSFIVLYSAIIVAGWFVLLAYGYAPLDALFEVVSAQSTVGLSTGITSPTMPLLAKISLTIAMWMGRLELIPVLLMIAEALRRTRANLTLGLKKSER
jgi:trk system potassium uptake protein TrkH